MFDHFSNPSFKLHLLSKWRWFPFSWREYLCSSPDASRIPDTVPWIPASDPNWRHSLPERWQQGHLKYGVLTRTELKFLLLLMGKLRWRRFEEFDNSKSLSTAKWHLPFHLQRHCITNAYQRGNDPKTNENWSTVWKKNQHTGDNLKSSKPLNLRKI